MFLSLRIKKLCLLIPMAVIIVIGVLLLRPAPADAAKENGLRVPVIMYHSISRDESRLGDYVVTPQQFEQDIMWLSQHGYEAITVNDLILHVRNGTPLPRKPVIITLDDGHLNALTQALPVIKRHGFKMTVSCVGEWTLAAGEEADPDENYSYLDAGDIRKLRETGLVEVACHSYDMHSLDDRRGVLKAEGESDELYCSHLLTDIYKAQKLFDESCGFKPNVFTYPYGLCTDETAKIVKAAGFEATLGCEEGVNVIDSEKSLYGLKRFTRPFGESSEEFFTERGLA